MPISKKDALDYHSSPRPGKIEITPTKPCRTQRDLGLAYTPGVAEPCLAIQSNPHDAFKYMAAAISLPSSPMEPPCSASETLAHWQASLLWKAKRCLFKRFAGIDV